MRIILLGYMYSGKTTVGRRLASKLKLDFYDLDLYFEEKYRISVQDFFIKYDEKAFREIERQLLIDLLALDKFVLSTGGGTPCFYDNMDLINKNGLSVYLKLDPQSILHRAKHSKKPRPVFRHIQQEDLPAFILKHLKEREAWYSRSHLIFKGENADVNKLRELVLNAVQ